MTGRHHLTEAERLARHIEQQHTTWKRQAAVLSRLEVRQRRIEQGALFAFALAFAGGFMAALSLVHALGWHL